MKSLLLTLVLTISTAAFAEAGKSETYSFIKDKIEQHAHTVVTLSHVPRCEGVTIAYSYKLTYRNSDKCLALLERTHLKSVNGNDCGNDHKNLDVFYFNFGDIDNVKIKTVKRTAHARTSFMPITLHYNNSPSQETFVKHYDQSYDQAMGTEEAYYNSHLNIYFEGYPMAERVLGAMNHIAKICNSEHF